MIPTKDEQDGLRGSDRRLRRNGRGQAVIDGGRDSADGTSVSGNSLARQEIQIRNSLVFLLPVAVGVLIPIVTLPVFTRYLATEAYGAWALATAFGAFGSGLANFGLILGFERNFFQYTSVRERSALLYSTLVFILTALAVLSIVIWVVRDQIARFVTGTNNYGNLFFWAFCAVGIASLKSYYLIYFRNTHNAKAHVRYSLYESVLKAMLAVFFVAYLRMGAIGIVAGHIIGSLLVFAVLSVQFLIRLPFALSFSLLKGSLRISVPLIPQLLFKVVGSEFDKYAIGLLGSLGGVGVYSIGQRIARMVFSFTTALENVFAPQVYERMFVRSAGDRDRVGTYLTPFAYVSIGGALLVGLFSDEIVTVLADSTYHGAVVLVSILTIYYGLMFFGKQPQLVFAEKTWIISVLSAFGIALNAGLVLVGITLWGTVGAAWGTMVAGAVHLFVFQAFGQRYYRIAWEYKALVKIFGLFFITILFAVILTQLELVYWLRLPVKIVLVFLYLRLGVHLDILNVQTLSLIRNAISRPGVAVPISPGQDGP